MKPATDKFQYKNQIKNHAIQLAIDADFFDRFFANVFVDIFEKEAKVGCVLKKLNISITQLILNEVIKIDKKNKSDFLLLFEDYQKINSELDEIIIRINKDCVGQNKDCDNNKACTLNLAHYPLLCERTNNIELKNFRPEHTLTPAFLEFIESVFGQFGIFYLYSSDKELMFIGRGENLGNSMLEAIWERNIDGYASAAFTQTMADIYIYETYEILCKRPLLNNKFNPTDSLSFDLPKLEQTEMIKIFER